VGSIASGPYVADKGFEGEENHRRWREVYGACIIHPPKRNTRKKKPWSKPMRRWVAAIRQIVERVYDKLFNAFGLWRERPHIWKSCELVWQQGSLCTTSVCGSRVNSVVPD